MFGLGKKSGASGSDEAPKTTGNSSIVIGLVLAAVVFVLVFIALISIQQQTPIMVAKNNVSAYSLISASQFMEKKVPRDSVENNDVSPDEFKKFISTNSVVTTTVLKNQRLDQRAITATNLGTLSVAKSDEEVVGVSTSFPGSIGGALQPGMVVDVISSKGGSSDTGTVVASEAKVMGVGRNAAAGISTGTSKSKQADEDSQQGGIIVILAVDSTTAPAIAGQEVIFALYPDKCFNASGNIKTITSKGCPQSQPKSSKKDTESSENETKTTEEEPTNTTDTTTTPSEGDKETPATDEEQ